jgi:hypothetical protein
MIGNASMMLCKKACFCFDGRNILNGPALKKSISKWFLGSQLTRPSEGAEVKKKEFC